jgi:hypothetical protein
MKTVRLSVLLFTMCVGGLAQPQSSAPDRAQGPSELRDSPSADRNAAQRRYDPLAGHAHLRGGIWDNALNGINPDNKDLGESVRSWRQTIAAETIQNVVFWTASAFAASVLFALLFLDWLLHDRARRLYISVNILTQIANAYLDARDHALEAIEKHNQLADDYNALAEKMAAAERQKTDNRKRVRGEPPSSTVMGGITDDSPSESADTVQAAHPDIDSQFLAQLRREAEVQTGQRLAHQISALNEKNKTLRASLNESVAEIERLKREQAAMKGV